MTTETVAKEILKQVKGDDASLTNRVDKLEDGQHEMKTAIAENTVLTKKIVESTSDLVATTDFARKLAKVVMWLGGIGAGLYGMYQGYEFFQKLWATGL
jgi:hypothetical protein